MKSDEKKEFEDRLGKKLVEDPYDDQLKFWSVTYRTFTDPQLTMLTILRYKGIKELEVVAR